MQPCAVCGGQVVDAAGYCVQCGTFRGVPAQPPPYAAAPPPQQYPYPGYQAGPTSGPPVYQGPISGPPGYQGPISGPPAGYGLPVSAPPKPRSPYVVPLLALSGTLVVLVVAIVIVVLVRSSGDPAAGPGPASGSPRASAGTSAVPAVDACVVGRWKVTSHQETVGIPNVGTVTFTGGQDAVLLLKTDGTGTTDYGSGTTFTGKANGRTITLIISGTVTYRFHTANGTVSFSDVQSAAEGVVKLDGSEIGREKFQASDDPAKYTCNSTRLTESTNLYETVMARES